MAAVAGPLCAFPGCSKTAWREPSGSFSLHCSRTHRDLAAQVLPTAMVSEAQSLCKNCQSRPVYVENGHALEFCGRRCASAYHSGGQTQESHSAVAAPAGQNLCKNCNIRQIFIENGRAHDFCGRRCAAAYNSNVGQHPSTTKACALSNCSLPVCVQRDNPAMKYCCEAHGRQAVRNQEAEGCLFCGCDPKVKVDGRYTDFCGKSCREDATSHAPIILQLKEWHKAYQDVEDHFTKAWRHPTRRPAIKNVWKIYAPKRVNDRFLQYRKDVEKRTGLPEGNTRRRWHGTMRSCSLGDSEQHRDLCSGQGCSLCRIIHSSFALALAGSNTNYGRFGKGIYTSATSSKAHDYSKQNARSRYMVVLLNEVVMGKGKKLYIDNERLTQPPRGFDSVIGEPGLSLNYDEAVVYTNDAIRPMFLVVYEAP